jgi:ADP-ribose pyrophosphatase
MCDPDGGVHARDVVRHPGAVSILPLHDDGTVTLVRQYRVAPDGDLLEIPAGKADRNDEDPVDLALRELAEEVGLAASSCVRLAGFYLSPGYSDEWHETFLATGLSEVPTEFDGVEERHMDLVRLDLTDAVEAVASGGIVDAKTIIALLATERRGPGALDMTKLGGRRRRGLRAHRSHRRAFLGWLRVEQGPRPVTVQAYRRDLLAHLAWLERSKLSVDGGPGAGAHRPGRWVRSLLDEGRARSSVAGRWPRCGAGTAFGPRLGCTIRPSTSRGGYRRSGAQGTGRQ